jgi:arylsulfatase A
MKWISWLSTLTIYSVALKNNDATNPNIIIYLADDLGPGEVNQQNLKYSFMVDGITPNPQRIIRTPNIEQLASQSMRFENVLGASVCAPSRYILNTGQIVSRAAVRGNSDATRIKSLPAMTLPKAMQHLGYKTILVGKYGFGIPNTNTSTKNMGYDHFFGYGTHNEAHYPFPAFIWNNSEVIHFPQNIRASKARCLRGRCAFAPNMFAEQALSFIHQYANKQPFFLMWATISDHLGAWNSKDSKWTSPVPSYYPYGKSGWVDDRKGHAAMIYNVDQDIKSLLATLQELQIDESTIVIFASDNGAENEYINFKPRYPAFFTAAGGYRGLKRDVYQGGIAVPLIVRWKNQIPANTKSSYPWAFHDIGLTLLDLIAAPNSIKQTLAGTTNMAGAVSVAELWLKGDAAANKIKRSWLSTEYCEAGEGSCIYALFDVRVWNKSIPKLIFNGPQTGVQLFDLAVDPTENNNLAPNKSYADLIAEMQVIRNEIRIPLTY